MSKIRATLALSGASALAVMAIYGPGALAAGGNRPSANGHGTTTALDGGNPVGKRQFSFNAVTKTDGTVDGHAVVHNPAFDFTAQLDVSCLLVVGNRASLGGTVTKSNDPGLPPGIRGFWTVFDNGEPGTLDTISSVYFDDVVPASSCQDIGEDDFAQMPIEGGNIQVKP